MNNQIISELEAAANIIMVCDVEKDCCSVCLFLFVLLGSTEHCVQRAAP